MGKKRLALAVTGLVVAVVGLVLSVRKGMDKTVELPVYSTGAQRMAAGEEIYRPTDLKPFTYPPFFAIPFMPLGEVPAEPPRPAAPFVVWYLVNFGALVWIMSIIHRHFVSARERDGPAPRAAVFWILTTLLAARHITAVFENQSHDLLVFLLVALGIDAFSRRREGRAGAWVGVAAACKATPLLFCLPFVLQRRVVAMLSVLGALAAATLLPDLLFPRGDGGLWVIAWYETFLSGLKPGGTAKAEGAWTAHSFLNQSLSGTLCRLLSVPERGGPFVQDVHLVDLGQQARSVVTLLSQLGVIGLLALAAWPGRSRQSSPSQLRLRRFGEGAAVLCGMVLLSPMSSKSHFCVLLFAMAFCVDRLLRERSILLLGLLMAVFLLGTCTAKGLLGREIGNWFLAHGSVTWTALLMLVASTRVLTRPD